jgi:flagellar hook-associated protein 1 FlgK
MYYSTFFGFELGKRALDAEQLALHTTSQNIANASTPGYSRQSAVMVETNPFTVVQANMTTPGQLGTGVKVSEFTRARDMLLEGQVRQETSTASNLDSQVKYLGQVESVIQEPTDSSIGTALSNFWGSWQDLSANPEDTAARNSVLGRAQQLVDTLKSKDTNLSELQTSTDQEFRTQVQQINSLGSKIRDLNVQINQEVGVGLQPNDLMDQRDQALSDLSKITNCQVQQMGNGLTSVTISGHTLVQDGIFVPISVTNDALNNNYAKATWSDDNTDVTFSDGQMKGLTEIRDTYIPSYRTSLNDLAQGLMATINPLHAAGYAYNAAAPSGEAFFSGTGLQDMAVNPTLVGNPAGLAVATNPSAPGDGTNALAIAQQQNALTMSGGTLTLDSFYQSFVAQIGLDSQSQTQSQSNQTAVVQSLTTQQQSISGVNLDEEMSNLMKYQEAYNAAARIITTMDDLVNTIINKMGLTTS